MGSTTTNTSYRLRLRNLERGIRLIDTPGILEAGIEGQKREQIARDQAANADLLVLVVDGDLRAAELEAFAALESLKRLLLVLTKCDLRGEDEEKRLLALLRRRTQGRIAAEDVITASASPQPSRCPGQPLQPAPEIDQLLRRIAQVLTAMGRS